MADRIATVPIAYDPNYGMQRPRRDGWRVTPLPSTVDDTSAARQKQMHAIRSPGYKPEWITKETHDITDGEYYDPDANEGVYTHQAHRPRPRQQSATESMAERPSSTHETKVVANDDIDFFMAILGGRMDKPPRSTDSEEAQRRSTDTAGSRQGQKRGRPRAVSQETSSSRGDDDEDVQRDVDFWHSLMSKA